MCLKLSQVGDNPESFHLLSPDVVSKTPERSTLVQFFINKHRGAKENDRTCSLGDPMRGGKGFTSLGSLRFLI